MCNSLAHSIFGIAYRSEFSLLQPTDLEKCGLCSKSAAILFDDSIYTQLTFPSARQNFNAFFAAIVTTKPIRETKTVDQMKRTIECFSAKQGMQQFMSTAVCVLLRAAPQSPQGNMNFQFVNKIKERKVD